MLLCLPVAPAHVVRPRADDLGGFHNGTLGNRSDIGDEDPKSLVGSEMYLRWLQFGAVRARSFAACVFHHSLEQASCCGFCARVWLTTCVSLCVNAVG
eukprot:COSAG02_NODE_5635_length_4168_cov_15.879577_2_plen_98_part_00